MFAREYLAERGLCEEICREFRLGLAPGGAALTRGAAEQGFTRDELAGAGLTNRRGNDYFSRRLLFPLADARGRVRGFQARQLYEDDPLRAKYVNSPEGDLFRKGDLLYGLDLAKAAIAKQNRALVVEGNPDAIALRQAGFEPAVAAMGTALTERQLAEIKNLTRNLSLCFDADAAGQEATLRGMELAIAQGFEIKSGLAAARHRPRRRRERLRGTAADGRGLPAVPGTRGGGADASRSPARVRACPRDPCPVSRFARAAGRGSTGRRSARPSRRAAGRARSRREGPYRVADPQGSGGRRSPRAERAGRRAGAPAARPDARRSAARAVRRRAAPPGAGPSRRRGADRRRARRRPRRARRPGGAGGDRRDRCQAGAPAPQRAGARAGARGGARGLAPDDGAAAQRARIREAIGELG